MLFTVGFLVAEPQRRPGICANWSFPDSYQRRFEPLCIA